MTRSRCVVAAVAAVAVLGGSCSSGGRADRAPATTTAGATAGPAQTADGGAEQRAIEIARRAWAERDPKFDFAATRPEADPIAGTYDVAFVPAVISGPGGEPHVVVDVATGKVVRTYRTK